jgi:hypothetical protein
MQLNLKLDVDKISFEVGDPEGSLLNILQIESKNV